MKNVKTLIKLAALTAILTVPLVTQGATIVGTKHDLRTLVPAETQVCVFCHIPHNADITTTTPLWNHKSTAVTAYTLYSSPTLNATLGQPGDTSKACLSCHDGTVALNSYGGVTNGTPVYITGAALLGTSLANDHPIGFTYDSALATADKGLVTPASTSFVDAGSKLPLFAGKMECGSCHAVHDSTLTPFLRVTTAASALCTSCHTK